MANYVQNTSKYEKWAKEGRGQGQKETYKLWLNVFDVPSEGRCHRIPSFKLKREITAFQILKPLNRLNLHKFLMMRSCLSLLG